MGETEVECSIPNSSPNGDSLAMCRVQKPHCATVFEAQVFHRKGQMTTVGVRVSVRVSALETAKDHEAWLEVARNRPICHHTTGAREHHRSFEVWLHGLAADAIPGNGRNGSYAANRSGGI